MAFKRSWVRLPSAPPSFALEVSRATGGKPFFRMFGSNALPERRVSPEASPSAKASARRPKALADGSEDIPRSFNEGELAKGDNHHEVCLSSPKPFRPSSTLCRPHHQPYGAPPGTQRWRFFTHIQIPPLEGCYVSLFSGRAPRCGVRTISQDRVWTSFCK